MKSKPNTLTAELGIIDMSDSLTNATNKTRNLEGIKCIVIHHSASNTMTLQQINRMHNDKFKEGGISYHFVVDHQFNVIKCRKLSEVTPHTRNFNSTAIGICFFGDFTRTKPTIQHRIGFDKIMRFLRHYCEIKIMYRHLDKVRTICPGTIDFDFLLNGLTQEQYLNNLYNEPKICSSFFM